MNRRSRVMASILLFVTAAALPLAAGDGAAVSEEESSKPGGWKVGPGEVLAVPIPIANPTVGTGLGLMFAYATKLSEQDEVSPPSIFGTNGL